MGLVQKQPSTPPLLFFLPFFLSSFLIHYPSSFTISFSLNRIARYFNGGVTVSSLQVLLFWFPHSFNLPPPPPTHPPHTHTYTLAFQVLLCFCGVLPCTHFSSLHSSLSLYPLPSYSPSSPSLYSSLYPPPPHTHTHLLSLLYILPFSLSLFPLSFLPLSSLFLTFPLPSPRYILPPHTLFPSYSPSFPSLHSSLHSPFLRFSTFLLPHRHILPLPTVLSPRLCTLPFLPPSLHSPHSHCPFSPSLHSSLSSSFLTLSPFPLSFLPLSALFPFFLLPYTLPIPTVLSPPLCTLPFLPPSLHPPHSHCPFFPSCTVRFCTFSLPSPFPNSYAPAHPSFLSYIHTLCNLFLRLPFFPCFLPPAPPSSAGSAASTSLWCYYCLVGGH